MRIRLAIAVAPVWVWCAVISALPHKEERFLFPVYPLVSPAEGCHGAACALTGSMLLAAPDMIFQVQSARRVRFLDTTRSALHA